jgi:hypothetical protein
MADGSVKLSIGIFEDIFIRVEMFFIPIDFVMVDMKKDPYVLFFLDCPFLITIGKNMLTVRKFLEVLERRR